MEKPVSINLQGTTISELTDFRYDVVANEHQFFQVTFSQLLLQNDFGLTAAESYYNTPVGLNFLTQSGKLRQVTGNIITLKQIERPGYPPEVTIAGTFYSPAGKFPRLNRFLWSAIVLPLVVMGSVCLYVHLLSQKLVEKRGTIASYSRASSYKGSRKHSFRIDPFQSSFKRSYYRPIVDRPSEHIDALFTSSYDGYHPDSTGQAVRFFVLKDDVDQLPAKESTVPFFNLQHGANAYSSWDQSLDILYYAKDQLWWYFVWLIYAFAEIASIGFVFYYYKMFAFNHDPRKSILSWIFTFLIVILNVPVILIFI
ncbi:hypothetical protein PBAL39_15959 [Pedobacter sp. BAL39]|uniref:hypothetical protein n=1 Tax=Pedobacter sp. BAL39 TaxID=391596 RepID=UPI000155A1D6|nr:hypothetical protein [Pedobacter sp. BAL39]EDM37935.1 hypothetical protein PBAL39_15959 [Pedobacter sp. BAL39]